MTCEVCGGPLSRLTKYGVCSRTRTCKLEGRRRWKKANPHIQKSWRGSNPDSKILESARARAREKGLPFSLRRSDLPPVPETCPILGIKLQRSKGKPTANSPALDRIRPGLGYVPGNVQWLSHRANFMKSDASPDELLAFAAWAIKTYA